MPCNSDYLNPTYREKELRRAANLYLYVLKELGYETTDPGVRKAARNTYGRGTDCVPLLCEELTNMSAANLNRIVHNARNKNALDLADWWEEHQEADRERLRKERREHRLAKAKETGLAKLTKLEREALGVRVR